jgi:UDP-N-acetylglucosamine 4,6-dehydratase
MKINNQKIFVFGGTGSLGQALVRRLSEVNDLILFSRDEAKHWTLKNNLRNGQNVEFIVGDIRDKNRVKNSLVNSNPEIVIIAAALKQVDTCESSPFESVQTNILGIQNIVDSLSSNLEKLSKLKAVLMVSTDKACAPTNVYGMSKAIAERIVTSANTYAGGPRFIGVRYGNVLESRGSVIPLFKHQSERQPMLTVTNKEMTRFIMTLDQSIDLIEATISKAEHGEIWLPKLKAMRIIDLAEIFANRYSKEIKITGIRPGEKIHEDLISESESIRVRFENEFFKMSPILSGKFDNSGSIFRYSSSDDILPKVELEEQMNSLGIFSKPLGEFIGRSIEEIDTKN